MVGSKLGNHRILAELGAGGMGTVYLAEDLQLGRKVALKRIPTEVSADRDRMERLSREARVAAALNHPNIVVLHSVETADGITFLTMEYVSGETLTERMGGRPMASEDALGVFRPLTDAVASAHKHGVIHRDLKPDNVMIDDEERVKVLDFGLAKFAQNRPPAGDATVALDAVTQEGRIFGTPAYMSPEQAARTSGGSRVRKLGRPKTAAEIEQLILRMAGLAPGKECPGTFEMGEDR